MKYDTAILIGRFQPLHRAHVEIIRRAKAMSSRVIILVGSSFLPRTYKNPWTFKDRKEMIESQLVSDGFNLQDFNIIGLHDKNDDQEWSAQVQKLVKDHSYGFSDNVAIIGHMKDESSYYLKMFPQWKLIDIEPIEPLNATDIRDLYFRHNTNMSYVDSVLTKPIWNYLCQFSESEEYRQVIREREHIEKYKLQYSHLPYEPVFVTVDNVIFQSGHVLMVKRKSEPGKGLWALPGGFLNAGTDKTLIDAAIRELKEETGIKVPEPVLKGSIKGNRVFDRLDRSARGRTITHAFHIVLPDGELVKVKGSDDAEVASWIPISALRTDNMFEDHYHIIEWALGNG